MSDTGPEATVTLYIQVAHGNPYRYELYCKPCSTPYLLREGDYIELWEHGPTETFKSVQWSRDGRVSVAMVGCIIDPDEITETALFKLVPRRPRLWFPWRTIDEGEDFEAKLTAGGWQRWTPPGG
jgi:hypothetical protein